MTAYTNILFPAFALPSGRWVKIDMSTQPVAPISDPYTDAQETMEWNPWAAGGLPLIDDAAAPDSGMQDTDALEFTFHNVPIKESVDDTTLQDLLQSVDPMVTVWNIRYWISPGFSNSFDTAPDFWGIIEATEIEGSLHLEDRTWDTYTLSARNCLALLERVKIEDWLEDHLNHATYDHDISYLNIDGIAVNGIIITNADGSHRTRYRTASGAVDPIVVIKMFNLVDVLYSFGHAIGVTRPVNDSGAGTGSVPMTWGWVWIDSPNPGPTETEVTFDDLCMIASLYHSNGVMNVHDQKWTLFDPEKCNQASVYSSANPLEVLKYWTASFGLTAAVKVNSSGQRYLEVRELESDDTSACDDGDLLEGPTIDTGDKVALGMRVVTSMNGELKDGSDGDRNIDQPWIGAMRLRLGGTWDVNQGGNPGETDDITCLNMALYTLTASDTATNIFKVIPRRAGVERTTVSDAMPFPPACYGNPGALTGDTATIERQREEAGSCFAKAILSYHWNGGADPDTDAVGIFRRYLKKLNWRETGIKRGIQVGSTRTVMGVDYTVRRVSIDASQDLTAFEGERGTYHA